MLDVKRVVFGLAAIAGFGGEIPSAQAAFPDDGQVGAGRVGPVRGSLRQVEKDLAKAMPPIHSSNSSTTAFKKFK
jgi:hypothetical protein